MVSLLARIALGTYEAVVAAPIHHAGERFTRAMVAELPPHMIEEFGLEAYL